MTPLRVEIDLATPWVPPAHGVHLDGLIAWAVADACMEDPDCTQAQIDAALDALPLGRHRTADGRWCWQASLLGPIDPGNMYRHFATAKTDADALAHGLVNGTIEGRKTIDLVRGMTKNDLYRFSSQHVTQLHAWCIGDAEAVALALARVQHVGGRGRLGFGTIKRNAGGGTAVRVVNDPDAEHRWLQRHLPEAPALPDYAAIEGRCIPPYWQSAAGQKVWRPISA